MGYKVKIRIRGLTPWIDYAYSLNDREADLIARELNRRVQIMVVPENEELEEMKDNLELIRVYPILDSEVRYIK